MLGKIVNEGKWEIEMGDETIEINKGTNERLNGNRNCFGTLVNWLVGWLVGGNFFFVYEST